MHPKVGAEHAALRSRPDWTRARGVMAPGVVAHELSECVVRLDVPSRYLLLADQPITLHPPGHPTDELDPLDDRLQILACRIVALLEIAEVDVRRVAWIRRAQRHFARPIIGVGLEDRPGEIVEVRRE